MAEDEKDQPFASSDDLKDRWPDLSDTEVAETLLSDASQLIRDTCPGWAQASEATLKAIACAMVKRAMIAGSDNAGLSSTQETTGPFSQTWNFSNPTGDLYLTRTEKQRLGQGRQRAFSISMETGTMMGQP
ncbi:Gp19/Gp15/Gp42 family protein [uncultured Bifidobacterium sp.]|uniref:Gp19/Gp15/Gp42 family protein n=1 Tax=uncultured Bifidobacterium sp. TaxID=165187 RepID=UPI0025943A57|nr:Gp19/Gp15/Gp42 family protein [uncultured Bifidobacterium sp.]